MAEHILVRDLTLDLPIENVFEFFSNAENLGEITPPELDFEILTSSPIEIKKDSILDYKIKLRGIPLSWQTLITEWNPPYAFTDKALKSPYKQWIHRHTFTENREGGTDMKDEVLYRLPFEPFGDIMHWYVRRELDYIFDFRQKAFSEILKSKKQTTPQKEALSVI